MVAPKDFFHPGRFTTVDFLRVRQITQNGNIHATMTVLVEPPQGGSIEVNWRESWLIYRTRDAQLDIIDAGMYPSWMVAVMFVAT